MSILHLRAVSPLNFTTLFTFYEIKCNWRYNGEARDFVRKLNAQIGIIYIQSSYQYFEKMDNMDMKSFRIKSPCSAIV